MNNLLLFVLVLNIFDLCFAEPKQPQKGCRLCATCGNGYDYYGGQKMNTGDYGDWMIYGQQCSGDPKKDLNTQWHLCCQKDEEIVLDGICKFCTYCGGSYKYSLGTRIRKNDWGGFNIFGYMCQGNISDSYNEFSLCCTRNHITSLCQNCSSNQSYGGQRINEHDYGYWSINKAGQCGTINNFYDTLDEFKLCSNYCPPDHTYQNGLCYPTCLENCESCNTPNTCDVCNAGYIKISTGICAECSNFIENCDRCSSYTQCITCQQGYVLYNNKCELLCLNNCKSCSEVNNCDECEIGYQFNQEELACEKIKCFQDCETCSDPLHCFKCANGLELNSEKGTCIEPEIICPESCICEESNICKSCNYGYEFKDGQCVQIQNNDETENHELEVNENEEQQENENENEDQQENQNEETQETLYQDCQIPYCLQCTDNNFCTKCLEGYTLLSGDSNLNDQTGVSQNDIENIQNKKYGSACFKTNSYLLKQTFLLSVIFFILYF